MALVPLKHMVPEASELLHARHMAHLLNLPLLYSAINFSNCARK